MAADGRITIDFDTNLSSIKSDADRANEILHGIGSTAGDKMDERMSENTEKVKQYAKKAGEKVTNDTKNAGKSAGDSMSKSFDDNANKVKEKSKETKRSVDNNFSKATKVKLVADAKTAGIDNFEKILHKLPKDVQTELLTKADKGEAINYEELLRRIPTRIASTAHLNDDASPKLEHIQSETGRTEEKFSSLKTAIGGGIVGGAVVTGIQSAASGIAGLGSEAIEASDSIYKFKSTMKLGGFGEKEINSASKEVQKYANETVYELGDVSNTTAQLAANGVKGYMKLTEAAGNLNAQAGGNAETFKSVAMMLTQTAGAGKLTTQNWNQLADAIPGASGVLQKAMKKNGAYTGNFRDAMAAGKISSDEFNKALMQLGMNDGAKKAAKSTETFEGAFGNLKANIVTGMQEMLQKVGKKNFTNAINGASKAVVSLTKFFIKLINTMQEHKRIVVAVGGALAAAFAVKKIADFIVYIGRAKKALLEFQTVSALTGSGGAGGLLSKGTKTATVASSTAGGTSLVGNIEKTVTKSGSKWNLLGRTLGGRLINGAGLALTAWDAGSSIAKAVGSGKAQDKYKAAGKTAGTVIGGAIGAIGGPTGAMIGASIGDQLGSTKTAQKITKGLAKAFKQAKVPKIKVKVESMKKAYEQLNSEAKKYYSDKQKQDKKDIQLLYKNGDLTKAEYQKRLKSITDEGKQASKFEKLSQADRNAIAKYYAQSRASLETKWDKKIAADKKKWDNQILKDTAKYGANSEKVKKDESKKSAAIKTDENKKSKALDKQRIKFATTTTAQEARLHTTLNGKIQLASNKEASILKKLTAEKGKLNNKQLQDALNSAQKQYKNTVKYANQEYSKKTAAATRTANSVRKAANNQANKAISAAKKQYKDTVSAANNQYKGNSKWAEQQRAAVKKKAKQQRDSAISSALDQKNKVITHASNQANSTIDKAKKQHDKVISDAKNQRNQVKDAASNQSKGVVKHATNQANSSMESNKKQGKGTHSIWKSIAGFFNKLTKPFGVKAINAGSSSFAYTRATDGAYATGGGITRAAKALVGEAGVELKYQPYSGTVDLIGTHGPEFIDVKPGDQILNARDTQKVFAGNYGRSLPGYAKGTTGIAEFLSKIKSGASGVFDDVSDAASDALSKITNPKKTLEDLAAKTFNINSVSGVGSMQRGASKGMVDKSITSIAGALKKLIKSASDATGDAGGGKGAPSGAGVQRWASQVKQALKANGLSTSKSMVNRVLRQINTESGGNQQAVGGNDGLADGNATGLMQTKPGTFRANAFPGHGDIFNGYDNLLAALHYAKVRYGSSLSGLGEGHGYANGGLITQPIHALVGEDGPETILPLTKTSRAWQLLGQAVNQINGGATTVGTDNSDVINQLKLAVELLTQLVQGEGNPVPVNVALDKNDLYKKQASDVNLRDYQSLA